MRITLKHLARDLGNVDPHKLRGMLRNKYGKAKGRRWSWPDQQCAGYRKVKTAMEKEMKS